MCQLELEDAVVAMFEQRGRAVMTRAMQEILNTACDGGGVLDSALRHYARVNLPLVVPVFPALMSISYEAVMGIQRSEMIESVGVAMALIAFSADVHDDVVDCSDVKYGKRTVCGRFGSEVALLVGDVLLVQGYTLLHSACENLLPKQKQEIFGLTLKAVFEMSSAQALERKLTKKTRIDPDEYFEIMRLKGVVAELQCRVGGIIGQADDATLEVLTSFGRTVGMLGTIHDEFNDMLDTSELQHRIKFECPPLPMVYAVQDKKIKTAVENFVKNPSAVSSKVMTKKIAKLVLESKDVYNLKQKINEQTVNPKLNALLTKNGRVGHDVSLLLNLLTSNK